MNYATILSQIAFSHSVRVQMLDHCIMKAHNLRPRKGETHTVCELTFRTLQVKAGDFLTGAGATLGLIVWLPRAEWNRFFSKEGEELMVLTPIRILRKKVKAAIELHENYLDNQGAFWFAVGFIGASIKTFGLDDLAAQLVRAGELFNHDDVCYLLEQTDATLLQMEKVE